VVCNSSTLIALARIGHLDILEKEVKSLLIPSAVYEEVVIKGLEKPGAVEVREAKWIEKKDVYDRELVMIFNTMLDLGESEAIVLAKEVKADLLIIDDEEARKKAILEGLNVIGQLAFLI
jgi:predicted nucleic acid-binding protein